MDQNEKAIISPSGQYKAIVLEKPNCYKLDLYILSQDLDSENGTIYGEYWSRQTKHPILIDKNKSPEGFAIQELRALVGEPDLPLSIEWIRDFSFCQDAKFLAPGEVSVFCICHNSNGNGERAIPLEAKTIIDFSGLCLVEEVGCEGQWQMGQIDENGSIYCWGSYSNIKEAIIGL